MTLVYKWMNERQTVVNRFDSDGSISSIPANPDNTDYQDFLKWCEEGNSPEPYVAPPAPAEPTPEEKLAASGLTVDELKSLLGL